MLFFTAGHFESASLQRTRCDDKPTCAHTPPTHTHKHTRFARVDGGLCSARRDQSSAAAMASPAATAASALSDAVRAAAAPDASELRLGSTAAPALIASQVRTIGE
jgi:hypothetical protein